MWNRWHKHDKQNPAIVWNGIPRTKYRRHDLFMRRKSNGKILCSQFHFFYLVNICEVQRTRTWTVRNMAYTITHTAHNRIEIDRDLNHLRLAEFLLLIHEGARTSARMHTHTFALYFFFFRTIGRDEFIHRQCNHTTHSHYRHMASTHECCCTLTNRFLINHSTRLVWVSESESEWALELFNMKRLSIYALARLCLCCFPLSKMTY